MRRFFRARVVLGALLLLLLAGLVVARMLLGHMAQPGDESGLSRIEERTILPLGTIDVSALVSRTHRIDAPRLVYVHGTPGDATNWGSYLRHPVAGHRSIAIDRPGFGRTTPDRVVTSFAAQAAALAPFLGPADSPPAVLVGHSLGAPVIAQAAIDFPDRVGAIVLVSGSLDPDLEKIRWYNRLLQTPAGWLFSGPLLTSNREVLAAPRETTRLAPLLARVRCPVVIVHGTRDRLVPFANVEFMQERFVAAPVETTVLEGADHFIIWTDRERVREAIAGAVEKVYGFSQDASSSISSP